MAPTRWPPMPLRHVRRSRRRFPSAYPIDPGLPLQTVPLGPPLTVLDAVLPRPRPAAPPDRKPA